MLKIVRLSLQDRPPPNTNHAYVGNTIKVCENRSFLAFEKKLLFTYQEKIALGYCKYTRC